MSLKPNPIVWFEIPVADLPRAKQFYEAAFETPLAESEMGPAKMAIFPMERDVEGATGALVDCEGFTPSQEGSLVYFHVPSIEASLEKIAAAGGKTLMPKTSIGEHGFVAQFQDSEGNRVALHEAPVS